MFQHRCTVRAVFTRLSLGCLVACALSSTASISAQSCDLDPAYPLGEWIGGSLSLVDTLEFLTPTTGSTSFTGSTFTLLTPLVPGQPYTLEVVGITGSVITEVGTLSADGCTMFFSACSGCPSELARTWIGGASTPTDWIRGDTNNDGIVNIADAIYLLHRLYPGPIVNATALCVATFDTNDDGGTNIADAIFLLNVLFQGEAMVEPFPLCGTDPTPDPIASATDCPAYWSCP